MSGGERMNPGAFLLGREGLAGEMVFEDTQLLWPETLRDRSFFHQPQDDPENPEDPPLAEHVFSFEPTLNTATEHNNYIDVHSYR